MSEDDLEQIEYIPARKMRKEEKPEEHKRPGIASRMLGAAKGVGGFVKREVQGELQAGKDIARASPRLAERAIISGAREAKAGTEIAGWVGQKEVGFREWQAKRAEAKARRAQAEAIGLQTQVAVQKSRFDVARLKEAEATVRRREAENQRRSNVINGLMFGGTKQQETNPFAVRHPLESLGFGSFGVKHTSIGKSPATHRKHRRSKRSHPRGHSKGRKISFTDSTGKKVSFMVKK
jgi:hypothetical protein